MTRTLYPTLESSATLEEVIELLQEIIEKRGQDVGDFDNLPQIYVLGRTTARVPTSATDVVATDNEADIVNDGTYEYKLLDISGTLKWDRRTLNTTW